MYGARRRDGGKFGDKVPKMFEADELLSKNDYHIEIDLDEEDVPEIKDPIDDKAKVKEEKAPEKGERISVDLDEGVEEMNNDILDVANRKVAKKDDLKK